MMMEFSARLDQLAIVTDQDEANLAVGRFLEDTGRLPESLTALEVSGLLGDCDPHIALEAIEHHLLRTASEPELDDNSDATTSSLNHGAEIHGVDTVTAEVFGDRLSETDILICKKIVKALIAENYIFRDSQDASAAFCLKHAITLGEWARVLTIMGDHLRGLGLIGISFQKIELCRDRLTELAQSPSATHDAPDAPVNADTGPRSSPNTTRPRVKADHFARFRTDAELDEIERRVAANTQDQKALLKKNNVRIHNNGRYVVGWDPNGQPIFGDIAYILP